MDLKVFFVVLLASTTSYAQNQESRVHESLPVASSMIPFKKDISVPNAMIFENGWSIIAFAVFFIFVFLLVFRYRKNNNFEKNEASSSKSASNRSIIKPLTWIGWLGSRWRGFDARHVIVARLTPRHSLHEVEWQDRRFLIGCCDGGMHIVASDVMNAASNSDNSTVSNFNHQDVPR